MSSKRGVRRKQCGEKRKLTEEQARQQTWHLNQKQVGMPRVTPYRCPFCHCWHVGHPPQNVQQSLRDKRANERI